MPTWAKKQEPISKKREKEEEEGRRRKKEKKTNTKVNASLGMRLPRLPHSTQKDLDTGGLIR